jgi:hypothetical protein
MNSNANLRTNIFIIAVALLFTITMTTATVSMLPSAFAGGDDDDKDEKTDGNKNEAKKESGGLIADCDTNEAENIFICTSITPVCRPGATCLFGEMDPGLIALPISWR